MILSFMVYVPAHFLEPPFPSDLESAPGLIETRPYISDDIGGCYKSVYAPDRGDTFTVQARGENPAPTSLSLSLTHTHALTRLHQSVLAWSV